MTSGGGFAERLRREAEYAAAAVQFLTRLPVPHLDRFEARWLDSASGYFPLVGAIVGGIAAAALLTSHALLPGPVLPSILAVAAGMLATGAFHEDGLADTFDGLGGGQGREQKLAIMKDSRVGTYGLCALSTVLALKVAALSALPLAYAAIALIATHAAGRIVPVAASALLPYGGDTAGAKVAPIAPSRLRLMAAMAIGLLPFALLPSDASLAALAAGSAAAAIILAWSMRSIGGHTGDVLGAAEQAFEVAALVALAGMLGRS